MARTKNIRKQGSTHRPGFTLVRLRTDEVGRTYPELREAVQKWRDLGGQLSGWQIEDEWGQPVVVRDGM